MIARFGAKPITADVGGRVVNKPPECPVSQARPGLENRNSPPLVKRRQHKEKELDFQSQMSNLMTSFSE
jgi:hypothetical protein